MIDTHCHLDEYENIDEIVTNFDGILITSGYDDRSNLKVIELVSKYKNVYGTLGIHPEEASNNYNLKIIEENLKNPKIVAVGEIGLDYHYTKENMEEQKKLFMRQLDLALKYLKPIVVHSRDAISDTYNILSNYNLTGTIHCFSSSLEMALKFIDLGYKIGVGGVLTFKNGKKLREVVAGISLDNILLETDSPYMSPEPYRGLKNKPQNVYFVLQKLSELKKLNLDEVLKITNDNARKLFNINDRIISYKNNQRTNQCR